MACALRLSQLIDKHNSSHADSPLSKENIYVLEKAREIGQHCLSGALLDPRSMRELLPGFETEAPIEAPVAKEAAYFLTKKGKFKFPITPPPLRDHGNYVISLNRFVKWLGDKVEEAGITVFPGFAGSELLLDGNRATGVRTDDKGVDKQNQKKSNFEPGYDLQAKVVILAEGSRGSLTRQLLTHFKLQPEHNPQTYGQGVKELWELPPGRIAPGQVIYTMGWPLTTKEYGGAWIYGGKDNTVSLGFVSGLDYADPRLDPQHVLQEFKRHPLVSKLLAGGKMIRYGAKSLPNGGWWAVPPLAGDGWLIIGDSAGLLNSQRLKGFIWRLRAACWRRKRLLKPCKGMIHRQRSLANINARSNRAGSKTSCGRFAIFIKALSAVYGGVCSMPDCNRLPADGVFVIVALRLQVTSA